MKIVEITGDFLGLQFLTVDIGFEDWYLNFEKLRINNYDGTNWYFVKYWNRIRAVSIENTKNLIIKILVKVRILNIFGKLDFIHRSNNSFFKMFIEFWSKLKKIFKKLSSWKFQQNLRFFRTRKYWDRTSGVVRNFWGGWKSTHPRPRRGQPLDRTVNSFLKI